MQVLNATETREALPMREAVDAMRLAFDVDRDVPQRTLLGSSMFMPGRVRDITGVKVVSIVPGNPSGLVAVFGPDGEPLGVVDGPTLTSIRTGAVCGLATELLAPEDASQLVMLGAGAMAADQIAAIRAVRPIERVTVWSRSFEKATRLASTLNARATSDPEEALADAHIVSTATPSVIPLFDSTDVSDNVHVNAVGSFTPEMVELPAALLERAFVVVDDYAAAAAEAGDLIRAGRAPDVDLTGLLTAGRTDANPCTVFKSVGIASQDIAAAAAALTSKGK